MSNITDLTEILEKNKSLRECKELVALGVAIDSAILEAVSKNLDYGDVAATIAHRLGHFISRAEMPFNKEKLVDHFVSIIRREALKG